MRILADKVLIMIPESAPDRKIGDLYIPQTSSVEQYPQANVIEVGPDCSGISKGDTILFDRYAMETGRFKHQGKQYFLLKEDDVLAIIT